MTAAVETWFGDAFTQLHPLLQVLHRSGGTLTGTVDVRLGKGVAGWMGQWLARKLGIPISHEPVALEVAIYSNATELHWDRTFNKTSAFLSTFTPVGRYPSGHWVESSGPLRLYLGVCIVDGGWQWQPKGASLWFLPVPAWALPRTSASKRIESGLYQFNVQIALPLLGTVLAYGGKLTPLAASGAGLPNRR
jgi:hypothetical protein